MELSFLYFVLLSIAIIVVPGPNVLVVVSTSISSGVKRGLQTVVGTSLAMLVQLFVAAFGTAWFVQAITQGFLWLKWLGVIYLIYLGFSHLIKGLSPASIGKKSATALGSFQRGFWVSLTNPKTILFFGAFIPQFVSPQEPYLSQVILLSSTFWLLALVLDSGYALLSGKLVSLLKGKESTQNRVSGFLFLGAGTVLATTENS